MRVEDRDTGPPLLSFVNDIENVPGIPPEPVKAGHNQFVPWPKEF